MYILVWMVGNIRQKHVPTHAVSVVLASVNSGEYVYMCVRLSAL